MKNLCPDGIKYLWDKIIAHFQVMTKAQMRAGTETIGKLVTAKDLQDVFVDSAGDTMTGNLHFSYQKKITGENLDTNEYVMIGHNSVNLWIGAQSMYKRPFIGDLVLCTGWDDVNGTGNTTVSIAVPKQYNPSNPETDIYYHYSLWHSGNFPKEHSSTTSDYGLSTTSKYGHAKLVNNLTESSYTTGDALSAYQGYLLNQKIAGINTDLSSAAPAAVNVATSTNTQLLSKSLDAGTYLIIGSAGFASNNNGNRALGISDDNTTLNLNRRTLVRSRAANSEETVLQVVIIYSTAATKTLYLMGRQNSGSTLSVTPGLRTIKLK